MIKQHQLTLLVALIDKIYHHFHHHVFLFRPVLRYHQRKGYEGVVGYTLGAILTIENMVVVHKPKKECGGNTFVSVTE